MRLKGLAELQPVQPEPGRFARRRGFLLLVGSAVLIGAVVFWLIQTGGRPLRGEAVRPQSQTPGGMMKPNTPDKTGGAILGVQVIKPIKRDVVQTLRLPATISPYYQTTLYSKVSGYLKKITVDKGDVVKAGQILAVAKARRLGPVEHRSDALPDPACRLWLSEPDRRQHPVHVGADRKSVV